jgi:chemotaxis protein methyltransferase CheR
MEPSRIHKLKMDLEQMKSFQSFFMDRSGLVFEGRRISEMESAIAERMIALGFSSFDDYRGFLDSPGDGADELNQLVLALTVGETRFFRTPDQFAALRKYILPELIEQARGQGRELRLLSAGCSTGEEPYTLAILLHQLIPDLAAWQVRIAACDINREYLQSARAGTYSERKLNLVDPATREVYFKRTAKNLWKVTDPLRSMVDWNHFNLNAADFSSLIGPGRFHLVLCRNVLIYFNLPAIERVIAKFHHIVEWRGYLMLGYSETLFRISDRFQSIHTPEAFFYQKVEHPSPVTRYLPEQQQPYGREELLAVLGSKPHAWVAKAAPDLGARVPQPLVLPLPKSDGKAAAKAPIRPAATPPPAPAPECQWSSAEEEHRWEEAIVLFAQERFSEAREIFERMHQANPNSARAHVGLGFLHANLGSEEQSRRHAEEARRLDDLLPEIYLLFALLDEKCGELNRSLKNYQRVIMLAPEYAMAHFNLGNLFLKLDRRRDALREFNNTRVILERDPDNPSLRFSGGLSREALIAFCRIQN